MPDQASNGEHDVDDMVPSRLKAKVAAIRDRGLEDLSSEELDALLAWGRRHTKRS
jgi:hypothetical protein